jgi:hypothetical protein
MDFLYREQSGGIARRNDCAGDEVHCNWRRSNSGAATIFSPGTARTFDGILRNRVQMECQKLPVRSQRRHLPEFFGFLEGFEGRLKRSLWKVNYSSAATLTQHFLLISRICSRSGHFLARNANTQGCINSPNKAVLRIGCG